METLDKIYITEYSANVETGYFSRNKDNVFTQEYIRKDIVDETVKTVEDHAYFAGQEKFREKLIEWIQEVRTIPHENAIIRDLAFQEVINKLNSM